MTFLYCPKREIRLTLDNCKAKQCPHAEDTASFGSCRFVSTAEVKATKKKSKKKSEKNAETTQTFSIDGDSDSTRS